MEEISQKELQQLIAHSRGKIFLEFYSNNCGPCKLLEPLMLLLSEEHSKEAAFYKIDIKKAPELSAQYEVNSIPMVIMLESGQEKSRIYGSKSKGYYEQLF